MWLISRLGAFSIVRKPDNAVGELTVRARVRADLEAFLRSAGPDDPEILVDVGTDYKYRAVVSREFVGDVLFDEAFDLDYPNFKNEVVRVQGPERSHLYSSVWGALLGLEQLDGRSACRHPHTLNGVCQYCGLDED